MPAISDPGALLVAAAAAAGYRVIPIPGPSAVLAALTASGLPTESFMFVGFLPAKASARKERLEELAGKEYPPVMPRLTQYTTDSTPWIIDIATMSCTSLYTTFHSFRVLDKHA